MSAQGKPLRCEIIHDNFQNYKKYNVAKAQLVIADIPYNIGTDAYGSNPMWYKGGDNANGESKLAKRAFFNSDGYFKIAEYMHFCSRLLRPEPKEKGKAPAMIVFCAFDQIHTVAEYGARYGFKNWYPLFFCKNYSAQVLKANMRIVGATEFAVVLYRDKLPKFNNGRQIGEDGKPIRGTGKMVFDWFKWERDGKDIPKIHPTQKPVALYDWIFKNYAEPGQKILDTHLGSGSSRIAAYEAGLGFIGFEIDPFYFQLEEERFSEHTSQTSLFHMEGKKK